MGTLYDTIRQKQENQKRVPPIAPVISGGKYTPLSIQMLQAPRIPQAQANAEKLSSDMSRGVTISQGTPDPIQKARQSLSGIPVIGKFLTGTGPQGPSNSLYEPGSLPQSLVEKGIVGFMLEGFQKKVAPTRAEVGEQIFTRYEKLADVEPDEGRRLELAIQDVISNSPGQSKSIAELKEPGINLSEKEKDALFWTNTLEDVFAVLDAPVFVGSTKIPKNALLEFLKKTDNIDDIVPRLRMIGVAEDVATEVAPKIAKSTNEIQIARFLEDAKKAVSESTKPSLFARIQEKVATKLTPGKTNRFDEVAGGSKVVDEAPRTTVKRADEVTEGASERFFRSVQGGSKFDELSPDDVVPAFIRDDLDTYVAKQGDEYVVIEGRTGQQLGDPGQNVAQAVQRAKEEVESMGNERLTQFLTSSPLSPRYTQVVEKAPRIKPELPPRTLPKGIITADQLRLTDKAAARRLAKLERMAETAPTVDKFVDNSGITRESMEATVKKQGYKDVDEFYTANKAEAMSKTEASSRSRAAEPDERAVPNEEHSYSLMAEQYEGDSFVMNIKKEEAETVVDNLRAVFADLKGIDLQDPKLKFTEEDLAKTELQYEFIMDALMDDPARALSKYANKYGELPEVNGKEFIKSRTGSGKEIRNSKFGQYGDDLVTELGFDDADEAIKAFEAYKARREDARGIFENLKQIRNSIRLSKQMDTFVEVNQKKLATELQKNRTALAKLVEAAERAGFRKGVEKGNRKYEILVEKLRTRRNTIGGIKWRYSLSNSEMRKAQEFAQKEMNDLSIPDDPRFMTKAEFTEYTTKMEEYAAEAEARRIERGIVKTIIEQKELKNTENLREVMGLPTLSEMTLEQLGRYEKVLNTFRDGDEFLSKRTLEVIDRTALKGARTMRQVREYLSKEVERLLGYKPNPQDLENLSASAFDYVKWDTALAESKPFYGFIVNRTQKHILDGETNFLRIQNRIEEMAKAASKSRVKLNKTAEYKASVKRQLIESKKALKEAIDPEIQALLKSTIKRLKWSTGIRGTLKRYLAPTHTDIIRWLEARGPEKDMYWKTLTKEEQEYASYMRNYYNSAYNYLSYIEELEGSRFIDSYFTHTRKRFLEKWIDDSFVSAIKNIWDTQKEDMAVSRIIDADTGRILAKSKFFQYTIFRSGEGEASQNATQVFLQYAKLFERKKMLDKLVAEADIYTQSLAPKDLTQRGLEMDRTMKEFMNNYLNNKKGRRIQVTPLIPQNGGVDIFLRVGNTLVSMLDLGWSLTSGAASILGEQIQNYIVLGKVGTLKAFKRRLWDTGIKRFGTPKGQRILNNSEAFIGRNIWTDIMEADTTVIDKTMKTALGLFSQSTVEANKILLLGSLTKAEMKAGKMSTERMAALRLDAGRWRDMGADVKSILGSTSVGKTVTKYKGWAIPTMRTTAKNLSKLSVMLKRGEIKDFAKSKELQETIREIEVSMVAIYVGSLIVGSIEEDSFLGKLKAKLYRESMTILQGLDPTLFISMPRLGTFLAQLAGNLKQIALLEEYKTDSKYGDKGDLKGVGGLYRQFTPAFMRQFIPEDSNSASSEPSSTGNSKLDSLNKLEKLESLEKLDKLDQLNKLEKLDKLDSL
jgi:hypothetical protein